MSGFSADWLALRAPHDARARDAGLLGRLAGWAAERAGGGRERLTVVDLGGGTGATVRAVAPALGVAQTWHVVEIDAALIAAGRAFTPPAGVEMVWHRADLTRDLEALIPDGADLVACSALLDLVSEAWLEGLCAVVRRRRLSLYAALTYDGRRRWRPCDPFDAEARDLFNRDQKRDKGFGPALGPDAPAALRSRMGSGLGGDEGWHEAAADWRLGPDDRDAQRAERDGWAAAIRALAPDRAEEIDGWAAARSAYIKAGRSSLAVGHKDQLWLPPP